VRPPHSISSRGHLSDNLSDHRNPGGAFSRAEHEGIFAGFTPAGCQNYCRGGLFDLLCCRSDCPLITIAKERSLNHRISIGLLVLGLTVFALPGVAAAKNSRPFRAQGEATWDNIFNGLFSPPAKFSGTIQATHLGRSAQRGTLFLDPPNANGIAPGRGSVTFTAANGDTLSFDYLGELNSITGEGQGRFTVTGGTGRFADATGAGTFQAQIDLSRPANQTMVVDLDGRISY
jgi:hypothetical protein